MDILYKKTKGLVSKRLQKKLCFFITALTTYHKAKLADATNGRDNIEFPHYYRN